MMCEPPGTEENGVRVGNVKVSRPRRQNRARQLPAGLDETAQERAVHRAAASRLVTCQVRACAAQRLLKPQCLRRPLHAPLSLWPSASLLEEYQRLCRTCPGVSLYVSGNKQQSKATISHLGPGVFCLARGVVFATSVLRNVLIGQLIQCIKLPILISRDNVAV